MEIKFAVFATDQINRHGVQIPLSVLADGLEKSFVNAAKDKLLPGTPTHVSHDMHRVIGWTVPCGLLLATDIGAAVGYIHIAETESELQAVERHRDAYFQAFLERENAPISNEFFRVLREHGVELRTYQFTEPGVLLQTGIASELVPQLFGAVSANVDKDGLTYYERVCETLKPMGNGAFLDETSGLVFFVHRFFRRGLSHQNHVNHYFLDEFHRSFESRRSTLTFRMRMDPDLVGYAPGLKGRMEFEFWYELTRIFRTG